MRRGSVLAIIAILTCLSGTDPLNGQTPSPPQGWLGLGLVLREASPTGRFLHVEKVLQGGPGFSAGIRPLDVISEIDGSPIRFRDDLAVLEYLHGLRQRQRVRFTIDRGSQRLKVAVTVAPFPPEYRDAWLRIYTVVQAQSRHRASN